MSLPQGQGLTRWETLDTTRGTMGKSPPKAGGETGKSAGQGSFRGHAKSLVYSPGEQKVEQGLPEGTEPGEGRWRGGQQVPGKDSSTKVSHRDFDRSVRETWESQVWRWVICRILTS